MDEAHALMWYGKGFNLESIYDMTIKERHAWLEIVKKQIEKENAQVRKMK